MKYILIIVGVGFVLGWFKFSRRGKRVRKNLRYAKTWYKSNRRYGRSRLRSLYNTSRFIPSGKVKYISNF